MKNTLKMAIYSTLSVLIAGFIAYASWQYFINGTFSLVDCMGFAFYHIMIDGIIIFSFVYLVGRKYIRR